MTSMMRLLLRLLSLSNEVPKPVQQTLELEAVIFNHLLVGEGLLVVEVIHGCRSRLYRDLELCECATYRRPVLLISTSNVQGICRVRRLVKAAADMHGIIRIFYHLDHVVRN